MITGVSEWCQEPCLASIASIGQKLWALRNIKVLCYLMIEHFLIVCGPFPAWENIAESSLEVTNSANVKREPAFAVSIYSGKLPGCPEVIVTAVDRPETPAIAENMPAVFLFDIWGHRRLQSRHTYNICCQLYHGTQNLIKMLQVSQKPGIYKLLRGNKPLLTDTQSTRKPGKASPWLERWFLG